MPAYTRLAELHGFSAMFSFAPQSGVLNLGYNC